MRPANVLFISSDQHSKRVLGCYGNPVVKTPNLDALAARGTRFERAYCPTPVCVPSRAALATGRHAHRIGSWDNARPYVGTEADSWGHRLTAQGHTVTSIGKLHYRDPADPTGFPDQRLPMHVLDGVGDLHQLLRDRMPARPTSRKQVLEAGPGEVEYTRYDRAIGAEAVTWLREQSGGHDRPWALFVSFVYPHLPLVVPQEYFDLYPPESLPLPVQWRPDEWPHHPAIDFRRRLGMLDVPFDEATIRRALQAYYGMVTFLDEQVGKVLRALEESGQAERTRIIYSTDHGDMLGEKGLWWKNTMYEASVGIPLIVAGPDLPAGKVSRTNVSLIDCFKGIVASVGAQLEPADADLPGGDIFELARREDQARIAFSEYHASFSPSGIFMLRNERYKYVYYVGYRPQLFDLLTDPDETRDLGEDPAYAEVRAACKRELRAICDPEAVDRAARADQERRLEAAGGVDAIIAAGLKVPYTPAPEIFNPAPVEARERGRR